jgi:ketosteroid isomerase-like protein
MIHPMAIADLWSTSERTGDTDALDDLLTNDFLGIGPVGFVLDKDAWIGRFGEGLRYETLELDDRTIRLYGDLAIVIARQRATGTHQGSRTPTDLRVSIIIVGEHEKPRIAGIQYSFIAPVDTDQAAQ